MGNSGSVLPEDDTTSLDNINFYLGKQTCKPDDVYIDEIHKEWFGKYDLLEMNHSYIQWLFPIREGGVNFSAQPLSKHESELFKKSNEVKERIIKSYELMLDFYGFKLVDKQTGKIERNSNYKSRFEHLNDSFHNYLRITRILKCLGLVGFEHYKKPLIQQFIIEIFQEGNLSNATKSLIRYWIPTLRYEKELKEMEDLVFQLTKQKINRDWYEKEEESWASIRYDMNGNEILKQESLD